jgi:tetratricopeptide (TPR) repeat protein
VTTTGSVERYRPLFERLGVLGEEVGEDAVAAIALAETDAAASVTRSRRAVEAIVKALVPRKVPDRAALRLDAAKAHARALLPPKMFAYVELVQRLSGEGPKARVTPLAPADALHALGALHALADWYLHTHREFPRPHVRTPLATASLAFSGIGAVVLLAGVASLLDPAATRRPTPSSPAGVSVWSRPWLAREARDGASSRGAPALLCACPPGRVHLLLDAGAWARAEAACGGGAVTGWVEAVELPRSVDPAPAPAALTAGEATNRYYDASLLVTAEKWAEAEASYDRILALAPTDPRAYEQRGLARLRADDPAGALDDLAVCLSLSPTAGRCHLYAADALKALGRPDWERVAADAVASEPSLAAQVTLLRSASQPPAP